MTCLLKRDNLTKIRVCHILCVAYHHSSREGSEAHITTTVLHMREWVYGVFVEACLNGDLLATSYAYCGMYRPRQLQGRNYDKLHRQVREKVVITTGSCAGAEKWCR